MRFIPIVFALSSLTAGLAPAQSAGYPASQRGSVAQRIAFTDVMVTYGRPVARGRALFGTLVPWERTWHPGADSATRISFSHDVTIEGKPISAGEYSIWLIPHERAPWTFILSREAHVFHTRYPGPANDALRIDVAPDTASHMESLTIYFPEVDKDDAIMRIHWGATVLPLRIKAPFRP